jgi:DNA-binding XRE family transcriptional regulator
MSIEDLSNALDIERKTFYNWEARKDFPASYLVKMSKVFHVSVDTLLGIDRGNTQGKEGTK